MGKTPLESESKGPRRLVNSMSLKKLQALMDVMEKLYGPEGREMSLLEASNRHPDLIAKLDNDDVESVLGFELTTDQVDRMDRAIEVGTVVRDARDKVFGKAKKKV